MSRTVIAAVVAVVIAALTAIAFFVTTQSYNDKVRRDAEGQLQRAYQVVQQLAQLEAIDVANKAERLAAITRSSPRSRRPARSSATTRRASGSRGSRRMTRRATSSRT